MKSKQLIFYFLLVISLIMVAVPTVPHHHHNDGAICVKDDLPPTDCCSHHHGHHSQHEDPCCTNDCIASFYSPVPTTSSYDAQPELLYTTILFSEPLFRLLSQPIETISQCDYVYLESLHSTYITCAAGLRAPPFEC